MFLQCRKMPNPFRDNDLTADYILLMERFDPRRVCDSRGVNFPIAGDSGANDDNGPSSVPIRPRRLSMDGGPAEMNSLYGSMRRSTVISLLAECRKRAPEETQAAFADGVNVAAFFLTNSCTLSGSCPVSVRTSSDVRSKRPARCRSHNAARWFTT